MSTTDPTKKTLYKLLTKGKSQHTYAWSLPKKTKGSWIPGDWHEVTGELVQCANGLHLTTDPSQRMSHTNCDAPEIYEAEIEGEALYPERNDEVVARKVRLLRRLDRAELVKLGLASAVVDAGTLGPYYAFLGNNRSYDSVPLPARHAGGGWRAGKWFKSKDKLTDTSGLVLEHDLSSREAKPAWLAPRVFLAEARGPVLRPRNEKNAVRASEVRLVRPLSWPEMKRLGLAKGRKIAASSDTPVVGVIKFMATSGKASDRRAGYGVKAAIEACVESRMPFALGDFIAIENSKSLVDWHGAEDHGIESMYRWLIDQKHESAIRSFEAWLGRKPFVVCGRRIAVGDAFHWGSRRKRGGTMFKVSSFDDEKHTLRANTYHHEDREDPHRDGASQRRWLIGKRVYVFTRAKIAKAEATRVLEVKRSAETEKLQQALRYRGSSTIGVELSLEIIHRWTDEQRAAALVFTKTKRAWNDPLVPVPDFINAAIVEMKRLANRSKIRRELQARKHKVGGTGVDYDFEVDVSEAEIDAEEQRRAAKDAA